MKVLVPIIIGLLVVGCGKKQSTSTDEGNNTPEKVETSKKQTLKDKIVEEYEAKDGSDTDKIILMDNGTVEVFHNGKNEGEYKWKIEGEEIHVGFGSRQGVAVFNLTPNGDLKALATIRNGKRSNVSEDEPPFFYKRIVKRSPEEERVLREKVIGTYEWKRGENSGKYVFLGNGIRETHAKDGTKKNSTQVEHCKERGSC